MILGFKRGFDVSIFPTMKKRLGSNEIFQIQNFLQSSFFCSLALSFLKFCSFLLKGKANSTIDLNCKGDHQISDQFLASKTDSNY